MVTKGMLLAAGVMTLAFGSQGGTDMTERAKGRFEVKVTPIAGADKSVASAHLSLAKTFAGDLTGTSEGTMWTVGTAAEGSGGYVAIEKVQGTLRGRTGSFTLLHQGTMQPGEDFQLRIVVVPGSGTDQLAGLAGSMTIRIEKGAHFYDFDYTLPVSK